MGELSARPLHDTVMPACAHLAIPKMDTDQHWGLSQACLCFKSSTCCIPICTDKVALMPDASWVHMLCLSHRFASCINTALGRQQGPTAQHARQTKHGRLTEPPVPERPTTAEMNGLLLCWGTRRCRHARFSCAACLQRNAGVLLLNPFGLMISMSPDSALQAPNWSNMGQRACVWISPWLLLTGLSAADP